MHITQFCLSPAALASMRASDIHLVDELLHWSATSLIEKGVGPHELHEIVCCLADHNLSLPMSTGGRPRMVPSERDREIFRLRVVEGLTLTEVGDAIGVSHDRVRQLTVERFGLRGIIPTVRARKWAATERRRIERQH